MKGELTLKNKEWLELIENSEEQIIDVGIKAYEEAINNKHLRFIVEMNKDGKVYYWYDIAGGNSYHMSVHNGTAIELFQFCFQYYDLEVIEESLIEKLIEKGYGNMIDQLKVEAEEECTDIEGIIASKHSDQSIYGVVEECRKEAIKFEISEYAKEVSEQKLEYIKEMLEDCN